jgi:hypothetical protein
MERCRGRRRRQAGIVHAVHRVIRAVRQAATARNVSGSARIVGVEELVLGPLDVDLEQ